MSFKFASRFWAPFEGDAERERNHDKLEKKIVCGPVGLFIAGLKILSCFLVAAEL